MFAVFILPFKYRNTFEILTVKLACETASSEMTRYFSEWGGSCFMKITAQISVCCKFSCRCQNGSPVWVSLLVLSSAVDNSGETKRSNVLLFMFESTYSESPLRRHGGTEGEQKRLCQLSCTDGWNPVLGEVKSICGVRAGALISPICGAGTRLTDSAVCERIDACGVGEHAPRACSQGGGERMCAQSIASALCTACGHKPTRH